MPPMECPTRTTVSAAQSSSMPEMALSSSSACRTKVFSSSGSKSLAPYPGRSIRSTENPLRVAMSTNDPVREPAMQKYSLV